MLEGRVFVTLVGLPVKGLFSRLFQECGIIIQYQSSLIYFQIIENQTIVVSTVFSKTISNIIEGGIEVCKDFPLKVSRSWYCFQVQVYLVPETFLRRAKWIAIMFWYIWEKKCTIENSPFWALKQLIQRWPAVGTVSKINKVKFHEERIDKIDKTWADILVWYCDADSSNQKRAALQNPSHLHKPVRLTLTWTRWISFTLT